MLNKESKLEEANEKKKEVALFANNGKENGVKRV